MQEPYKDFALKGIKTIEARLNRDKFSEIDIGDNLRLKPEGFLFLVTDIRKYQSFKDMINAEGIERVIPDKKSAEEAISIYRKFYTEKEEKKFGILAIEIVKI
jgi:ASC-1-like (ASCH) protein